jgi:hypothetical protein
VSWWGWVGAGCIGAACAVLVPSEPRSAIGTVLLVIAANCYVEKARRR